MSFRCRAEVRQLAQDTDLQARYVTMLNAEGHTPILDEEASTFFQMAPPDFWPIEDPQERWRVLLAADTVNRETEAVKIHTVGDNVWATIEFFMETPRDVRPVFRQSLLALRVGALRFGAEMGV